LENFCTIEHHKTLTELLQRVSADVFVDHYVVYA